jgi:NDP-sugar pyrophosphorylase family protein
MAPYSSVLPKALLPIDGQPILEVTLRQLKSHGFEHVTICVGYLADLITAYFGDGSKLGLSVDYVVEDEPRGTIGPLRLLDGFDDPLLVVNGDVLTALDFSDFYATHMVRRPLLTIATRQQRQEIPFGVMKFDDSHEVTDFREKPGFEMWISMGAYVVAPEIVRYVPEDGVFGIDTLVDTLKADGISPLAYPFEGLWYDLAGVEDCERATESFRKNRSVLLP